MNDEQLKQEIERALAVDPSPQFVARVRLKLAGERLRRPAFPWRTLAAGVAAAVAVAGVAVYQPRTTTTVAPSMTREVPVTPAPVVEIVRVESQTHQPVTSRKAAPRRPSEPEVLINPREVEAFRDFIEDVQERRIDPAHLKALFETAERSRSADLKPTPIAGLERIVVPPLTPAVSDKEGGSL
jgi:hypothetical protein